MPGNRSVCAWLRPWSFSAVTLLLVVWAGLAAASEPHPVKHGEGRLWRIERPGMPPSHIIGTIHISDPRVRDLPAPILEAFKGSQQAAFELRFTPEERDAMLAATSRSGGRCGCALAKQVDDETYRRVVALAAEYGLPEKAVNRLHPFMLAYIFSMSPEEHRRQAEGDLMLDLWLIQWAYDLGMRVEGLETLEEHIGVIALVPEQDHAAMLRELVDQLEAEPDRFERLVEDYLAGDLRRVFREVQAEIEREPAAREFMAAFLDRRNHAMVERLIPLMQRGRTFAAVGALHLPGEEGMLSLLERRGFRVTRVY